MGFQKDYFSNRAMGEIVGQKSRVIGNPVGFAGIIPFIETLLLKKELLKSAHLFSFYTSTLQVEAGDYLYNDLQFTPGL